MLGYGTSTTTLLRLSDLPYVEVFTEREVDGAFLDPSLEFCTRWGGEELLAKKVSREMHATKGDAVSYTQILLNHYKVSAMHAQKKLDVNAALDVDVLLHNKVKADLEHSRIENYAVAIDAAYKAAMEQRFSDFCVPLAFLMSHDVIAKQYDELRSTFPACHFVLATVTASKKFAPPMSLSVDPAATLTPTSEMHMKQRMILSAFLSLV